MIIYTQNSQNYMKRKATLFLGTLNSQNYMKREAMPSLRPVGFCDFCNFCMRKTASGRFLRFLREVLTNLAPIKSLCKQLLVMLPKHPVFGLDEFRIFGQKLDSGLADLRN